MSIRTLIERTGKSREQICREAGISRAYLSLLESEERKVGPKKVEGLAQALGVRPADLRPDLVAMFNSPSADAPSKRRAS